LRREESPLKFDLTAATAVLDCDVWPIVIFAIISVTVLAGWIRWIRTNAHRTEDSRLSTAALVISSMSWFLAVGGTFYATVVQPFEYFDPVLILIVRSGLGLSVLALAFSLMALRIPSSTRWHTLFASVGTLSFWLVAASLE
jgi:hypothetical protein